MNVYFFSTKTKNIEQNKEIRDINKANKNGKVDANNKNLSITANLKNLFLGLIIN